MGDRHEEKKQSNNGFKRLVAIVSLVAVLLGISVTLGGLFIKYGESQRTIQNHESAIVGLKSKQDEILRRLRSTETNTYAIAVKLEIEGIIKPVDK